ncbi:MAG TPA: TonB family protein [Pyrinomonadaceae bacterium]|nr:TonB family protein [Pyrinomonadaceae bacterium]
MFDKYIESGSEADQNPRRTYFLVSTIIVGILFVTGVIASLYAQDIGLGTDEFELSSMLAPVVPEAPEPPQPEHQQQPERDLPTRQATIDRVSSPTVIPDTTSVVQNPQREIPIGRFKIGNFDSNELTTSPSTGPIGSDGPIGTASRPSQLEVVEDTRQPEPPPLIKKVPTVISKGPVGGLAIYLPKPIYPAPARAIGMVGDVNVQVLIDEEGKVVSAKAVSGPILLKQEAERAAWKAKFNPTTLGDVLVKVTGVITYKFTK